MDSLNKYRYPGTRPFTEDENMLFYGRNAEIIAFTNQVKLEHLIVLFGKSGLGKSSLLNAGIIPHLKRVGTMYPITVRIGLERENAPVDYLKNSLVKNTTTDTDFFGKVEDYCNMHSHKLNSQSMLWLYCKRNQLASSNKPLLFIFDQFEELFLFDEYKVDEFSKTLASLLYGEMPNDLQELLYDKISSTPDFLTHDQEDILFEKVTVKVVLTIRSDLMSNLNRMKKHIPHVLQKTYELKALTPAQASMAITQPASASGSFISSPFEYSKSAIQKIVDYLSEGETKPIETFQLQLVCLYCEKIVLNKLKNTIDLVLKPEQIGELQGIFLGHYTNLLNEIKDPEDRLNARKLVEENMIIEGTRVPLPDKIIESRHHISSVLLSQLVDSRLLRSEPNNTGGFSYEISHDTLIEPITKLYTERRSREEHEKEESLRLAKLQKRRKRTLTFVFFGLAIFITGFSVFFSVYVQKLKIQAEVQKEYAEEKSDLAEKLSIEAQKSEKEARAREKEALRQTSIADSMRMVAEKNLNLAIENAKLAEMQRQNALAQMEIADSARQVAMVQENLAVESNKMALREKANALELRLLSMAGAMSVKSLQVYDPVLRSLLALQAFNFFKTNGGKNWDVDVYGALYTALKNISKDGFNESQGHKGIIYDAVTDPRQEIIYTTGSNGRVLQWQKSGALTYRSKVLYSNNKRIHKKLVLSKDCHWLFCAGDYPYLIQIDLKDVNNEPIIIKIPIKRVVHLSVANSGILFSNGVEDIYSYYFKTIEKVISVRSDITDMDIGSGGNKLTFIVDSNSVVMANIEDNFKTEVLYKRSKENDQLTCLKYVGGGRLLAIGYKSGKIRLINVVDKSIQGLLDNHSGSVRNINSHSNYLASVASDNTIKIWNMNDLYSKPIEIRDHSYDRNVLCFSGDGLNFMAVGEQNGLKVWPLSMYYLANELCANPSIDRDMTKIEWDNYVADDVEFTSTCSSTLQILKNE